MNCLLVIFAIIGAISAIPIAWAFFDGLMFATGYTILHVLSMKRDIVTKKPLTVLKYVVFIWPIGAFFDRLLCYDAITSITIGKWEWNPWFKYSKLKKNE